MDWQKKFPLPAIFTSPVKPSQPPVVSPAGVFAGGGSLKRLPPSVAATGERFMLFSLLFRSGIDFSIWDLISTWD